MRTRNPFAAIALALVSACAAGPNYTPPSMGVSSEYAHANAGTFDALEFDTEWWLILNDPMLDALIGQAMRENHDLRIAQANVAASRAFLSEGRLDRYPIVTAQASVNRQQASTASIGGIGSAADRTNTFYDAGLDATWELDFFGRVRRSNQALAADFEAAVADRRAVFVIVAAEVARTYIELRGGQYRLQVARSNAANQQKTYELTQALLDGGRGTDLDLARAQAQLEFTRATIPPLESEATTAMHRLAVLTGREPAALLDELGAAVSLPVLPQRLPVGDPAILLRRRPDVAAAERRLAAATARVGVATADLFPRVSLIGSAGYLSTERSAFGDSNSESTAIGPFLSWSAFDLGRVRARIGAAEAATGAQLAAYEQTVLTVLEETENALVRYARNRQRLASLEIAAQASGKAANLANIRYRNGVDSFLNVLDAEARLLEAQDALAQSETDTGLAFVALYKALGGGWESYEDSAVTK